MTQHLVEGNIDVLRQYIWTFDDNDFQLFTEKIFEDHIDGYRLSPGSTRYHHTQPGGLSEHTLEVVQLTRIVTLQMSDGHDDELDLDLVLGGSILHDIGKIYTYTFNNPTKTGLMPKYPYKYTSTGKLLNHIGIALRIVTDYAVNYDYTDCEWLPRLEHLIASHHGEVRRGWGSLVDPQLPEAHILHHCDMISSRVGIIGPPEKKTIYDDWKHYNMERGNL